VGTVHGPILGAALFVFLRDYLALRWWILHLLIFGALFIAIVLLLPGGLVEAAARLRALGGGRPAPSRRDIRGPGLTGRPAAGRMSRQRRRMPCHAGSDRA
jgi:hypothetical protein